MSAPVSQNEGGMQAHMQEPPPQGVAPRTSEVGPAMPCGVMGGVQPEPVDPGPVHRQPAHPAPVQPGVPEGVGGQPSVPPEFPGKPDVVPVFGGQPVQPPGVGDGTGTQLVPAKYPLIKAPPAMFASKGSSKGTLLAPAPPSYPPPAHFEPSPEPGNDVVKIDDDSPERTHPELHSWSSRAPGMKRKAEDGAAAAAASAMPEPDAVYAPRHPYDHKSDDNDDDDDDDEWGEWRSSRQWAWEEGERYWSSAAQDGWRSGQWWKSSSWKQNSW